jgi:hypothetical protein
MHDGLDLAGALLLVSALGAIPVAYPPLLSVWSASREDAVRIVARHRRAWAFLNAGFAFATLVTTAGLAALAASLDGDAVRTAALWGVALVYAIVGTLWCAVVAIRTRTTPALLDVGAIEGPPAATEVLLHAATGGMFSAFVLGTAAALVALGGVLLLAGGVAPLVAGTSVVVGALAIVLQLATGDFIPATLYLPTILLGLALLAGWT